MFLLRRAATRAIASTPTSSLLTRSRNIASFRPVAFLTVPKKWSTPAVRRSYATSDSVETQTTSGAEEAAAEAEENFAQTAAEAPVEENLTPAQQEALSDPTERSETIDSEALEAAAQAPKQERPVHAGVSGDGKENSTLYVGNLFYEVTGSQLERVFSRFGQVKSTRVVNDNRGLSRGFAYVEMESVQQAEAAIASLDMQVFEGRNLVVQIHKPKSKSVANGGPAMPPSETLFIGNLAYDMSDKDLNDLFRDIRNVTDVRVAIDRRTGQPRGFAHADFVDVASAVKAKEELDGKVVFGRTLRIDFGTGYAARGNNRDGRGSNRDARGPPSNRSFNERQ